VWFVFPALLQGYALPLAVSEMFAFGAEALLYWRLFPGMGASDAVRSSFICNMASFAIGLAI
jgi:hypothetical protein